MSDPEHNWKTVLLRRGDDPFDRAIWFLTIVLLASVIFSTAVVQSAAVLLLLVWVARAVVRRKTGLHRTILDLPFLAFVLARLLAIPFSIDPALSAEALRTEIVFYPLFFVFTSTLDPSRNAEIKFLLRLLLATAVVASIIGTLKYLLGVEPRASSTTSGYYTLGLYLCALFPLALLAGRDLLRMSWLHLLVCAVLMVGVVFTLDRLHWAGMVLAVLVVGAVRDRKLLGLFLAIGVVIVLVSPPVSRRLLEALNFTSFSSGRDVLWKGAFMIMGDHPIAGFGLRTFRRIFPLMAELTDQGIGSWHNDYLQVYMESGLLGLLSMLWFIVAIGRGAFRAFRAHSIPREYAGIFGGLLLSAGILFIVGGFLDTLVSLMYRFLFALIAVCLTAWQPRTSNNSLERA